MASANVCQGARLGALVNGAGTCPSTNTGGTALDTIRPTVGSSAMGDGKAGDLELNAVDGGGGRHRNRLRVLEYCSRSDHQTIGVPSKSVTVP